MYNFSILTMLMGSLFFYPLMQGYGLPPLALGLSSFLDGGPLRPSSGFYWQQYLQYYSTEKFLDTHGNLLANGSSPLYKTVGTVTQFVYQAHREFFKGRFGIDWSLPLILSSRVSANRLAIQTSGSGFGDIVGGIFWQSNPIMYQGRDLFIHRLELTVGFPSGKNKEPKKNINPATNFFYIDPYWAGTFYVTPEWAFSWRLNYLWSAKNKKTCVKPGSAVHLNFSTEYLLIPRLWVGINGYYLEQLENNKLNNIEVPQSREQVLALGFGALYLIEKNYKLVAIGNLFFETQVKNRSKGIKAVFRLLKHF